MLGLILFLPRLALRLFALLFWCAVFLALAAAGTVLAIILPAKPIGRRSRGCGRLD